MLVDFHTHTTYSDGQLTPRELINMACKKNIKILSVTDHDSIYAYNELDTMNIGDLTLIKGIEFSSDYKGKDVHILGYDFDSSNGPLLEYIAFFSEERKKRILKMVHRCREEGYLISAEELLQSAGNPMATLGRPHIAKLLVDHGYIKDINEAFETILSQGGSCYVPKYKADPKDILKLIHGAGGLAVLAHPVLIRNDGYVLELLSLPFDGIEVYHPRQSKEVQQLYLSYAMEKQLFITGGSDYHALQGRYPHELGEWSVTDTMVATFLTALKERLTI